MLKYFPHALSLLTLVIVCAHVKYTQTQLEKTGDDVRARLTGEGPPAGAYGEVLSAPTPGLPTIASFAGEPAPMQLPDVRERLDRELIINTYFHSSTIFLIKRAHRWLPEMEKILKENGIPEDFKYLPAVEGGFMNEVSPREAVGFWQIRKDAGEENGLEINREVDERYDPIKSTYAACRYLKKSYEKFGNWTNVLASYNRGMAGLQRALDDQQVTNYYDLLLNDETSRYVFRVLAIKEIIENPEKYGFYIEDDLLYEKESVRYVVVNDDIKDLVKFAKDQGINYKLLKRHNPWLRNDKLTVKRNETYQIAIPVSSR